MPGNSFAFLKSRSAQVLSVLLALQAVVFYSSSHGEQTPVGRPLSDFPKEIGTWRTVQEATIEKEIQDVLKADDTLSRVYVSPEAPAAASLFVAYFKSQRTGQAPHSPKNCMPGAGWTPLVSDFIAIPIPGEKRSIEVNRYVVTKGENRSLVLYWYQSRDRVVASEYKAKVWVVADAIRYNRTDTSIVKVVVPIVNKQSDAATETATKFVQAVFTTLRRYLPA